MKIKKLTIHNIASIENAVIDFTGAVLGNEPLFLISGETGSGKTTILNAICLALYNTAPNIEGVQNAQNAARIGGIRIDDSRQLMRQGSFDANVELVFVGNDGNEYEAHWDAHRAQNGNPQPTKISLSCQHTQLSLQGARDVAAAIESPNVVGLTYEQFCRTTMLAQGQFSKFMTSKDDEKSDILEKLTGTELYARIGQKVNERYKTVNEQLSAITNRIAGAKLMTAEERSELNEFIDQLKADLDRQQKSLTEIKRKYDWLKSADAAQKSRNTKIENLEMLNDRLADEQIKAHIDTIALWDATAEIRNTLNGIKVKQAQFMASERQLQEMQTEFASYAAGLEYIKRDLAAVDAELAKLRQEQKADASNVSMYTGIQLIETLIDTIISKRTAVRTQNDKIALAEKEHQSLADHQTKAETDRNNAREALDSAHRTVEEKKALANDVNIEVLRKVVNDFENDGKLVDECIDAMSNLRKKIQVKVDADKTLEELNTQIAKATRLKEEQAALQPEAQKEAEALTNQLKGMMDLRSHLVELQARFHETGTCPLCGSAVNGIHPGSLLDEEVAKAKDAATKAENRQKTIEKNIREAETVLQTTQSPLRRAIKAANDASLEEEYAIHSTNVLLRKFQLEWDDDTLDEKLQGLKNAYNRSIADAKQQLADGQARLDAVEPARQNEDRKRAALDDAENKLAKIKERVNAVENNIREANACLLQAQKDCNDTIDTLTPLLSIDVDLQNTDLSVLKSEIKRGAEKYAGNERKILSREQQARDLNTLIESFTPTVTELAEVLGANMDVPAKEQKGLEQKLHTFNVNVTKLNGSINTLKNQLKADEETAKVFFDTHNDIDRNSVETLLGIRTDVIQNYREERRRIEDEIKQTEGAIKEIDCQLTELNQNKPELLDEETMEVLNDSMIGAEEQEKKLNDRKVECETRLKDDYKRAEAQKDDIREKERLQHLANNWKVLNDAFGGNDGGKFKRIAQSYVLRSLLQKANYYLSMLNTRYELACTDGSLSISILDQAQGGAERNVSSLSGGEGFVVSLALALGLSAISKDKINVDTLFIDEGFGTLSSDYLETVINTLDRLHQLGGRRVGIISHVAELANRIPTQIQLKRIGPSSSKIEIVSL